MDQIHKFYKFSEITLKIHTTSYVCILPPQRNIQFSTPSNKGNPDSEPLTGTINPPGTPNTRTTLLPSVSTDVIMGLSSSNKQKET